MNPTTPNLLTTFEGAVETFRKHGIEPKHRARTLTEFDRIPFTLQPDEMLFKTANNARIPIPASAPSSLRLPANRFTGRRRNANGTL